MKVICIRKTPNRIKCLRSACSMLMDNKQSSQEHMECILCSDNALETPTQCSNESSEMCWENVVVGGEINNSKEAETLASQMKVEITFFWQSFLPLQVVNSWRKDTASTTSDEFFEMPGVRQ